MNIQYGLSVPAGITSAFNLIPCVYPHSAARTVMTTILRKEYGWSYDFLSYIILSIKSRNVQLLEFSINGLQFK